MGDRVIVANTMSGIILLVSTIVDVPIENIAAAMLTALIIILVEITVIVVAFTGPYSLVEHVSNKNKWEYRSVLSLSWVSASLIIAGMHGIAITYVLAYAIAPFTIKLVK